MLLTAENYFTYIVYAFKGGDHGIDVASALHGPVQTTIGHFHKHLGAPLNNEHFTQILCMP
jgi:hypothetical protein